MSPKLGQRKMDSIEEDRNYLVVYIDLATGDLEEIGAFDGLLDAHNVVKDLNAVQGFGPSYIHAVMRAEDFDCLEE